MYVGFGVLNVVKSLQRILSGLPYPGPSDKGWLALREANLQSPRPYLQSSLEKAALLVNSKSWFLHRLYMRFFQRFIKSLHGKYYQAKMLSILWPLQQASCPRGPPTDRADWISKSLPGTLVSTERPQVGSLVPCGLCLVLNLPSLQGPTRQMPIRFSKDLTLEKCAFVFFYTFQKDSQNFQ